ncbi:MAG: cytochrome c3 family protein, partial [Gemmatimonadales bacterium]
ELANVINDPAPVDGVASDRQYPICLRCHGDTYASVLGTLPLLSGAIPSNKRIEFQTANSSYHPVAGPGRNTSNNLNLQLSGAGLSTNSVLKCTDCHTNDSYETTTGTSADAPVGPHGSTYPSILRAFYQNSLPGPNNWDPANFDLCFRCHNENMLIARRWGDGARTNFYDDDKDNLHYVHLDDRADKSRPTCRSCHYNVHSNQETTTTQYRIDGVVYTTPPPDTPTRLINFHPSIRATGTRARPEWRIDTGTGLRQCYLQCHRSNGNPGGEVMNGADHRYTGPPSGDVP